MAVPMRKRWVMGNWKMHGSIPNITDLLDMLLNQLPRASNSGVVVFPPAIYFHLVREKLNASTLCWGAQNVFPEEQGPYTGEISGNMLKEFGCSFVLVGHSERRHLFNESDSLVARKYEHARSMDMTPVLCIGETLEERNLGKTQEVVLSQLNAIRACSEPYFLNAIIAYEPVWAIGTGLSATPEEVQKVHRFIRDHLQKIGGESAEQTSILYGGSVTPENASELSALADVDGVLVGGASLDASRFKGIVQCINS